MSGFDLEALAYVQEPYRGGCWVACAAMVLGTAGTAPRVDDLLAEAKAAGWVDHEGLVDGDALRSLLATHGVALRWRESDYDPAGLARALEQSGLALVVHAQDAQGSGHVSVVAALPSRPDGAPPGRVRWLDPRLGEAEVPSFSLKGPTPGSHWVALGSLSITR